VAPLSYPWPYIWLLFSWLICISLQVRLGAPTVSWTTFGNCWFPVLKLSRNAP